MPVDQVLDHDAPPPDDKAAALAHLADFRAKLAQTPRAPSRRAPFVERMTPQEQAEAVARLDAENAAAQAEPVDLIADAPPQPLPPTEPISPTTTPPSELSLLSPTARAALASGGGWLGKMTANTAH